MKAVLAKAGWKLDRIFYHRTVNDFSASLGNAVETHGRPELAERLRQLGKRQNFHLAMYPIASALAAIGQTGRMTVWARRA
jgi:hypothetical protein